MTPSHARESSIDLDSPDRPFDNIINFRDVGRTVNQILGRKVLKEGVLFRSARLDDASERDKRRLIDELHINTVIDLRSSTEHQMATAKRRAEIESRSSSIDDISATLTPEDQDHLALLPGVRRCLISLTGKAFERTLLWRLDWWNYIKVIALAASGYRPDAITIVGEQVMTPRGLIGLGQDTLDSSIVEMRSLFEILSFASTPPLSNYDEKYATVDREGEGDLFRQSSPATVSSPYPVLIHCTQGKDRTGLIVLLCLLLLGSEVSEDAIVSDYVRSEPELVLEVEERMREIRKLGLSEEYMKCPSGFVQEIKRHLEVKYGGVEGYLRWVGLGEEHVERIREVLLV